MGGGGERRKGDAQFSEIQKRVKIVGLNIKLKTSSRSHKNINQNNYFE